MYTFIPSPSRTFGEFNSHKRSSLVNRQQSHAIRSRRKRRCNGAHMSWRPAGLLREAVALKQSQVDQLASLLEERPDHPLNLRLGFFAPKSSYRLYRALRRGDGTMALISVMKRFHPVYDEKRPVAVSGLEDIGRETRKLELAGADAAFVHTNFLTHGTELADAQDIVKAVKNSSVDPGIPVCVQDFVIHPLQIAEASEAGACAVVIVAAAALTDLMELLNSATAMGLEAVVECHTELERDFALECGATILYFTNWDRATNRLHKGTAQKLAKDMPPWVLTIGGGGLVTAGDVWDLLDNGFNAAALGEVLLKSRRAKQFIQEIRSQRRSMADPFAGDFGRPFVEDYS